MPKKTAKSPHKKKDRSLLLTVVIFTLFLFFVAVTVFIQYQPHTEIPCANSISCTKDLSNKKEANNEGVFMGKKVIARDGDDSLYALSEIKSNVLGDTTADYKRIQVDLTNQRLYAFEGNTKVFDFPVSTGKWNPTPTGDFRIARWFRYARMAGGNPAIGTYYDLPNVPYTMYFGNASIPWSKGYSLHGAYWHNNFGHPMSHGCVNMRIEDAGKIYYWTNPGSNPGTLITIYGTTPKN